MFLWCYNNGMKTREQIEEKYKWDLSNYFASMQEWDNEFESIKPLYQQLATYEGKLGDDETLLECLKLENQVSERMGRLAVFIALKCKEDGKNSYYQNKSKIILPLKSLPLQRTIIFHLPVV